MDESFGGLVKSWRDCYDDMTEDTAELRQQVQVLTMALDEIAVPYRLRMAEIEEQIKTRAMAWGEGYKGNGVVVGYRSGYERASYDSKRTDMVLGTLRDILPE